MFKKGDIIESRSILSVRIVTRDEFGQCVTAREIFPIKSEQEMLYSVVDQQHVDLLGLCLLKQHLEDLIRRVASAT